MTVLWARARLMAEDDATELLRFGSGEALRLRGMDVGFPEVRDSMNPLPGRGGEDDGTRYTGAAAITLKLAVVGTAAEPPWIWIDRLRGYAHPGYRFWLRVSYDGGVTERRIQVRGADLPLPLAAGQIPEIAVSWRAPQGIWQDTTLQTQILFPTTGAEGGRVYPRLYPLSYEPGNVPGAAIVTNAGNGVALPYIDIYGFCTDPIVKNLSTGEQVGFTGLTVQAGDFIRVDMQEQAVLLSNDRGQSRYSQLDFTTLTWWGLPPLSPTQVAFVPGNPGPSCQALLVWRDTSI